MTPNPFTPTFGSVPPVMAGREEIIQEIAQAFDNGIGDPNLVTLFAGARGTGKTALLTYLARECLSHGWISVSVTALPGMLEEIIQQTQRAASEFVDQGRRTRVKGVRLAEFVEVEFDDKETPASPTWRIRMSDLLDELARFETGLLITVDEVRADVDEMVQMAAAYQHFVREGRKVALLMAGLPSHVSALLQDKSVSFLRRSNFHEIGTVDDFAVRQALESTIEAGGRAIEPEALARAVELVGGFPYMMQLLGYRAWSQHPEGDVLTYDDVEAGADYARHDMRRKIFDTTFKELSRGDVRFLAAMLPDEGPSALADIARRMGKKSNYASQYKARLIEQGVVAEVGQGNVTIELPLFKEYLRERLGTR